MQKCESFKQKLLQQQNQNLWTRLDIVKANNKSLHKLSEDLSLKAAHIEAINDILNFSLDTALILIQLLTRQQSSSVSAIRDWAKQTKERVMRSVSEQDITQISRQKQQLLNDFSQLRRVLNIAQVPAYNLDLPKHFQAIQNKRIAQLTLNLQVITFRLNKTLRNKSDVILFQQEDKYGCICGGQFYQVRPKAESQERSQKRLNAPISTCQRNQEKDDRQPLSTQDQPQSVQAKDKYIRFMTDKLNRLEKHCQSLKSKKKSFQFIIRSPFYQELGKQSEEIFSNNLLLSQQLAKAYDKIRVLQDNIVEQQKVKILQRNIEQLNCKLAEIQSNKSINTIKLQLSSNCAQWHRISDKLKFQSDNSNNLYQQQIGRLKQLLANEQKMKQYFNEVLKQKNSALQSLSSQIQKLKSLVRQDRIKKGQKVIDDVCQKGQKFRPVLDKIQQLFSSSYQEKQDFFKFLRSKELRVQKAQKETAKIQQDLQFQKKMSQQFQSNYLLVSQRYSKLQKNHEQLQTNLKQYTQGFHELVNRISELQIHNSHLLKQLQMQQQNQTACASFFQKLQSKIKQFNNFQEQRNKLYQQITKLKILSNEMEKKKVSAQTQNQSLRVERDQLKLRCTQLELGISKKFQQINKLKETIRFHNLQRNSLVSQKEKTYKDYYQQLKAQTICVICDDNRKDTIITKCGHMFCNQCCQRQLLNRKRCCPKCEKKFEKGDICVVIQ